MKWGMRSGPSVAQNVNGPRDVSSHTRTSMVTTLLRPWHTTGYVDFFVTLFSSAPPSSAFTVMSKRTWHHLGATNHIDSTVPLPLTTDEHLHKIRMPSHFIDLCCARTIPDETPPHDLMSLLV